jgi:hypothetical protein
MSVSHGGEYEDDSLLGYGVVYSDCPGDGGS